MKNRFNLLIIALLYYSAGEAQGTITDSTYIKNAWNLEGTAQQIITDVVTNAGYKIRFKGKHVLNHTYQGTVGKNDSIMNTLAYINTYCKFAYTASGDTIIIDDYVVYNVDSLKKNKSFIATQYDSTRHGKVLIFEYISPVVVLDSLLKLTHFDRVIKVQTSERVSGIIPLSAGPREVMTTHNWMINTNNKTPIICPIPPKYDELKHSYHVDTSAIDDSSYVIYSSQKRNNIKRVSFKHITLQELLKIIDNHNNYFVHHTIFFRKQAYVSGSLPLELPIKIFAKLICEKHQIFYTIDKNLVVFAEREDDFYDYFTR